MVHQQTLQTSLKLKQNLQKNKAFTGKSPFFVIGPFCTLNSFCLNSGLWHGSLYENDAVSMFLVSIKKRSSSFSRQDFIFQKLSCKVKVVKSFKISRDCHTKTCRSLKRRSILKISSTVFQMNLCSFYWF